ncbi:MAG: polymorphic toxin-type HINT domain-containing protein, partial [Pirellula sp.]
EADWSSDPARKSAQPTSESNQNIRALQRRIATVLRGATGAEIDDSPESWWDWYDRYEESYAEGPKPIDSKYAEDRTQVLYINPERVTNPFATPANDWRPRRNESDRDRRRHECLVKGTPVQTDLGLRSIETINVGDLVACQDIPSGQLRFNAVLRATKRPESDVREIVLSNGESIQSTLGHRWWVIGQGWVKTRDLTQGTYLRTATGFASIQKIKDGLSEVTYNLVVDYDHTYFVGQSRLLSFDASEAIPAFQKVPGFQE